MKLILSILFSILVFATFAQDKGWEVEMLKDKANFFEIKEKFDSEWNGKSYVRGKGWKQYKRWENFWESRIMDDGSFPMDHKNIWNSFKSTLLNEDKSGGIGNWSPLGPFDFDNTASWSAGSGRVNCVTEDPNDANTIYVGSPAGGAWKSTNGGSTWTPLSDELSVIGISSIAVDPQNSNIIYLATGDTDGGDTYSIGLMKSVDGGATWASIGGISANETSEILIDPTNSNTLWLATSGGLMKSTNGGSNWTTPLSGNIRDIAFKPGTPSTVYAASATQVFYTTNGGTNWNTSTGIPNGIGRIAIAVTPANNSYVYLLISKNDWSYQGVYRSNDSGVSFAARNTNTDVFESTQAWYDMAIAASDTDAETIVTGVLNVWRSTNGGSNLSNINSWSAPNSASYTHADIHFLRYFNGNLYCGSDGGVYKSTNNGTDFTDLSPGLQIGQFYRLGASPNDVNALSGGLQDNGGYAYVGGIWKNWYGADGMEAGVDPNNSNIRFGMIQYGDLYRTTNGANSAQSLGQPEQGRWVTPMQMDLNNDRLLAGYNDLHEYDYTTGWNQLSTFNFPALLRSIEIYDGNSDIIFVATDDNIYRTTNNGANFTEITGNLPTNSIITSIEVNPTNSNELWITRGGWDGNNHIFHTTNGGTNWTNITGNIPNLPCNIVKYDPSGTGGLYVGTDIGVYFLDLSGSSWVQYMNNLPNVIVNDLEINNLAKVIRAGTYGRGVWESGVYARNDEDAGISAIISPVDSYCNQDSFEPEITLTNYGTNELTSVTINYNIDGGANQTFNWTGSLLTGETVNITLPLITATGGNHTFNAYTTLPNGLADQEINNDASSTTFSVTLNGQLVDFLLNTDCWGSEVSWVLNDDQGATLISSPPYSDESNGGTYNQQVCLQVGCYEFIISDGYGDGMYGSQYGSCTVDGYYNFTNQAGDTLAELIAANASYGSSETNNFCVTSNFLADFSASTTQICEGATVDFTDISTGNPNQWTWTFIGGTPSSSNAQNPTGIQYNSPGVYDVELTISDGVSNSTTTINSYITVNGPTTSLTTVTECETYNWNGTDYTATGIYTFNTTNVNGCDSTATLDLTINQPSSSTTTITECATYNWNGTDYTTTGIYNFNTLNAAGCDSTATLDLTILEPTSSLSIAAECETYNWNGTDYTSSGQYTFNTLNAAGCDSTATLDLTILEPSSSLTTVSECETYNWNGTDYTSSGIYTFNTLNAAGCDSTATLDLTISQPSSSLTTLTECDAYNWNGTDYSATGIYTFTTTNAAGCDSVATLELTILNSSTSLTTVSECETYNWNGTDYTNSGIYTYNTLNAVGCDSTATLDLTILEPTSSLTTVSECESYNWNGTDYSITGVYTFNTTNAAGCDSTASLDLTITTIDVSTSQPSVVSIEANAPGLVYQWLNCDDNHSEINGETNQLFEATSNGYYAVQITDNSCIDTSACVIISNVGVVQNNFENELEIYPNPTFGDLKISLGKTYETIDVKLFNAKGQLINQNTFEQKDQVNVLINGAPGYYFVELRSKEGQFARLKVLKE